MSWHLSLAHWGAFEARVADGRVEEVRPFRLDPHPSPLIQSIPSAVHSPARITQPMVREGFLRRRGGDAARRRGGEPFVPVSWDEALALVADEIERVRTAYGNQAILGGSYGWSSAGRINHARTLARRFLFSASGCVDQATNYSFGAASVLLPHVVGGTEAVSGPVSTWPTIIGNTGIMLLFGGMNVKNSFVTTGGAGAHEFSDWLRRARAAGVEFINISPIASDVPDFLEARWLPIRPGSDTALILALAHTLLSPTIPTCIASCRAVASRPTAPAGSRAGRASFCPCACCRACFAAAFWRNCEWPMMRVGWASSAISPTWQSLMPSSACSPRLVAVNGSSTPSHPSAGRSRCLPISAATPIASPSPTPG